MRIGLQVPNFAWSPDQGRLGDTFALIPERVDLEPCNLLATEIVPAVKQLEIAGR